MLARFSEKAQKAIVIAESVAFDLGHSKVSSEHLLVSLLKMKESKLYKLLKKNDITDVLLIEEIARLFGKNEVSPFYIEYTNIMKLILEKAVEESKERNENKVSLEALSYALIIQQDCVAIELLRKYAVDLERLEEELRQDLVSFSELDLIKDLVNLNKKVKQNEVVVIGRETESLELIEILCRKEKNNAVVVGESGVGKTALVEKLAILINEKKVPAQLQNKTVYELDLTSVVAGTKYRGEFEDKLKKIIQKIKDDKRAIVFIDEIHNIVGAGGAEGAIDAANILKPYLARKEITCIGATTYEEYHLHFEKEKALNRRFQKIVLEENDTTSTFEILNGLKSGFEKFHDNIDISKEVLCHIIELSDKYIKDRHFPDKAIDVLDLSCVRSKVQGYTEVKKEIVEEVIQQISGIKLSMEHRLATLNTELSLKIKGQDEVITKILEHFHAIEKGLYSDNQPLLVLLFSGPTGVGKSEIAKMIATHYFGNEKCLIKLDMSEYKEASSISKLIGAPAGYIGYEKQSKLVESILHQPHSILLLDEVEKAHKDVLNLFLQVFDEGYLEDSHKRKVYFRNSIIIMTSNVGFNQVNSMYGIGFNNSSKNDKIESELEKLFSYEFINRIDDIIHFNYLNKQNCKEIIKYYFDEYQNKVSVPLIMDDAFVNAVIESSDVEKYGARSLLRSLKQEIYKQVIHSDTLTKIDS